MKPPSQDDPPAPSLVHRPGAGLPDNSSDPYFMQIRDDLADKGFFTATAEELITWARTGSLPSAGPCCILLQRFHLSGIGLGELRGERQVDLLRFHRLTRAHRAPIAFHCRCMRGIELSRHHAFLQRPWDSRLPGMQELRSVDLAVHPPASSLETSRC
jgi:hypothetical protein